METTKTCTIPKSSYRHNIININSFHLVRIRGSWVFSLQPARVGSEKLEEGSINQHEMFSGFFRFLLFGGGKKGGRGKEEKRGREGEKEGEEGEGRREGKEREGKERKPDAYTQQSVSSSQLRTIWINHLYFPTTLRTLSRLRLTRQQHEFMKLMMSGVIVL